MKLAILKRVTVPKGRAFAAKYERVKHNYLPANMRLRRPYKQRAAVCGTRCQRPQRVQQDRGSTRSHCGRTW